MSKRTGTSKAKPAVTCTPMAGAVASVTMPVVVSTVKAEEASSLPATAMRTEPATGFAIGRS